MLTNLDNVARYVVSGNTYSIPFPYWNESEIKAYITLSDETVHELTLGTDYTVSTPANTGTLTKVSAWTDAQKLTIMREVALTQEVDLINGEKIDGEILEEALDLKAAGLQQMQEQFSRTVKTSIDEDGSDFEIPNTEARKGTGDGTLLGFDSTGKAIVLRDLKQFDIDVAATASNASAASASALLAQKWAENPEDTPVVTGSYSSKHWAAKASTSAGGAAVSAYNADKSAEDSEAWAVGQRDGQDVPVLDPTYHKNAKYYADLIAQIVSGAMRYQGVWTITSQTDYTGISTPRLKGDMYYCQGTATTIDGVTYTQGDLIIFNQDVADGATITTSMIDKIDNTETVTPDNTVTLTNKTYRLSTAGKMLVTNASKDIEESSIDASKVVSTDAEQTLTKKTINGADNTIKLTNHNTMREVPKDITEYYTDGTLWDRIAGTNGYDVMEDIYVGDYFKMSKRAITANNPAGGTYAPGGADWVQGTQWVTVAGIDTLWNNGDSGNGVDYHHLVMVPGKGDDPTEPQHFGRSRMNATDTTANGYAGSQMHTTVLGAVVTTDPASAGNTDSVNKQLRYEFGSHLKVTRELLTNAMTATLYNRYGGNSGASSNWAWADCQAVLMSEVECYGSIVWSSSGYDTGNANHEMPAFKQNHRIRNNRTAYYWLKDVVSSAGFAVAAHGGDSSANGASRAAAFVRPRFVIA